MSAAGGRSIKTNPLSWANWRPSDRLISALDQNYCERTHREDCVHLKDSPDEHGFWGTISIRCGLKLKARRRDLPITENMAAVLLALLAHSKCEYVFTSLHDRTQPLSVNTLADQHRVIMETCSFHPDAGLHALRHTFLTEAGCHTQNVQALQKLAGHSKIETTRSYIHPEEADVLEIASVVSTGPC